MGREKGGNGEGREERWERREKGGREIGKYYYYIMTAVLFCV